MRRGLVQNRVVHVSIMCTTAPVLLSSGTQGRFLVSIGPKLEKMSEVALSKLKDRPKAIPRSLKAGASDEESDYWFLYAGEIHKNAPKGWTY